MLQLAAAKKDGDLDLVVMAQEFERLIRFRLDVVVARFRPNANFLELLLTNLGVFLVFVGIVEAHLAVIEDAANRRALVRRDFDKVEINCSGLFQGLGRGNYTELLSLDADEPDWSDTNKLVDARTSVRYGGTIE